MAKVEQFYVVDWHQISDIAFPFNYFQSIFFSIFKKKSFSNKKKNSVHSDMTCVIPITKERNWFKIGKLMYYFSLFFSNGRFIQILIPTKYINF